MAEGQKGKGCKKKKKKFQMRLSWPDPILDPDSCSFDLALLQVN